MIEPSVILLVLAVGAAALAYIAGRSDGAAAQIERDYRERVNEKVRRFHVEREPEPWPEEVGP